jgi:hypothetical protein
MSASGQLFAKEISVDEKIHELERELAMRRRVYKRMIRQHRCSREWAEEKIAIIEAMLVDYRALIVKGPRPRIPTADVHLLGDIRVTEGPNEPPTLFERAVLLAFHSPDDFRNAVAGGTAYFWKLK